MKYFFVLAFCASLFAGELTTTWYIERGFSAETKCKNGILVEVIRGKVKGVQVTLERTYCYDRSSWDNECNHDVIQCKADKGAEQ